MKKKKQCEVLEASQQQVKVERLCSDWAGPDTLGTGSVSGFQGWWLKLSSRCTHRASCFILEPSLSVCALVCQSFCVCGIRICLAPGGLPDGLDGESKQTEDPNGLERFYTVSAIVRRLHAMNAAPY